MAPVDREKSHGEFLRVAPPACGQFATLRRVAQPACAVGSGRVDTFLSSCFPQRTANAFLSVGEPRILTDAQLLFRSGLLPVIF